MDEFLALSFLLTGLSGLQKPAPGSLTATMARDYLLQLKEQFGTDFEKLLILYRSVATAPDPLVALTTHADFKEATEAVAKQVVNVWMLSQYRVDAAGKTTDFDAGYYEKGFVWPAIKAHAIGFSHLDHGYWTRKP